MWDFLILQVRNVAGKKKIFSNCTAWSPKKRKYARNTDTRHTRHH